MDPADQIIAASEARHASLTTEEQALVDAYEASIRARLDADAHLMSASEADLPAASEAFEAARDEEIACMDRLLGCLADVDTSAIDDRVHDAWLAERRAAREAQARANVIAAGGQPTPVGGGR